MTGILEEIQDGFTNLSNVGRMLPISVLPPSDAAYVFREDRYFGVAIELPNGPMIFESFAGARLITVDREVNNSLKRFLRLESPIYALRNEFAVVCEQMVAPGIDGTARAELIADPLSWWERWRHLLGNALVNRTSYAVLAEMLAVEQLMANGEEVEWRGPLRGSIDIATQAAEYEVKATITRYDLRIHVAGQFQLALSENRPLKLLHYRFEPTSSGDCINSVGRRLTEAGFPVDRLEELLSLSGLEQGCSARNEKFTVLEALLFPVDDNFPRITPASFATGSLPTGVVHIEYQVDLAALAHQQF